MQTPHILHADDEEVMRDIINLVLEANGFRVTSVPDGRQALIVAGRQRLDLILTDLDMPEMNGLELLRHLKNDAELRHIPLLLLSNHPAPHPRVQTALEAGAAGYISKSRLDLRRLPAVLSDHLAAQAEMETARVLRK